MIQLSNEENLDSAQKDQKK